MIGRKLKKLDQAISVSVVEPELSSESWCFKKPDELNGITYLHELYTRTDPSISGRATVPVLWDKKRGTIVSNESSEILRMMDSGFGDMAAPIFQLYPPELREEIDALNERIYPRLNNGVYRAGFATTQQAYDEAFYEVFAMLDELEELLGGGPKFLLGEQLTEADVRLFVTLVRFDVAYHGLFKCNLRRIADYPRTG